MGKSERGIKADVNIDNVIVLRVHTIIHTPFREREKNEALLM